ncbi:hypothetical protein ILUMI_12627 [Ignelater luminosus]|uniref:Pacifastin domain-containing protein n=1 Tax=Ignelater luminosus TaxID=2038154 RepID=A0A8K0GCR9_IGNLU|nr:hypothetical protein ILUMI_12627 [Ignelater luminosus]
MVCDNQHSFRNSIMKFQFVMIIVSFSLAFTIRAEAFECTDGVLYQENDCNDCFCAGGDLICRNMKCSPEVRDGCTAGTFWSKGCNTCWCLKHRGVVCSVTEC